MAIKKLYFKEKLFELRGLPSGAELLSPYEEESLHEYAEELSSSFVITDELDENKKYVQLGSSYFEVEEVTLNTLELIELDEPLKEYEIIFNVVDEEEDEEVEEQVTEEDVIKQYKRINERENDGGKTAFIVPIFTFSENEYIKRNFDKMKKTISVDDLFVIELAYLDNDFLIPESQDFIRLRGSERNLLWQKERLINIALQKIPEEYKNIAWVDADILFDCEDLSKKINDKLNQYSVIQLFSKIHQLDQYEQRFKTKNSCVYDSSGSPGYAWAMRREELDKLGGLFDRHITGNGDCLIEYVFQNHVKRITMKTLEKCDGMMSLYKKERKKSAKYVKSSVGFLETEIEHLYHGPYNRRYEYRENLLGENDFDPEKDIVIDEDNGLLKFNFERDESKKLYHDFFYYINGVIYE
jgi:hypothetical protein